MKVLLVNTSERTGGAAVACRRLMEALNKHGVEARMLVRNRYGKWHFLWERFCIWAAKHFDKQYLFDVDIANAGTAITRLPEFREADVIHLHWVNQGMLSLKGLGKILASGKPVVWTMHDMWPCTAICHHARSCTYYRKECHNCFYLNGGRKENDLSYRIFHKKLTTYRLGAISFVACSRWLQELAEKSRLTDGHSVCNIPNPLNTSIFCPGDKQAARRQLALPLDRKLILFSSVKVTDKRKGIDYLTEACRLLADEHPELKEEIAIAVLGNGAEQLESLLPFPVYPLSYISEEQTLAHVYRAADLFVTPSLQENLPNTLMEAMACGTPCVGFCIGGIPEMIDHGTNGYVAKYRSAADLARGMLHILSATDYDTLCKEAVRKAHTEYSEANVVRQYIQLYNHLIEKK
ncbi:MAG: glycosyltransferase family 4 protein [Bacteroides sp.]|nr:glycosyltransferase family 4 protein [Bacteroides sp.]